MIAVVAYPTLNSSFIFILTDSFKCRNNWQKSKRVMTAGCYIQIFAFSDKTVQSLPLSWPFFRHPLAWNCPLCVIFLFLRSVSVRPKRLTEVNPIISPMDKIGAHMSSWDNNTSLPALPLNLAGIEILESFLKNVSGDLFHVSTWTFHLQKMYSEKTQKAHPV